MIKVWPAGATFPEYDNPVHNRFTAPSPEPVDEVDDIIDELMVANGIVDLRRLASSKGLSSKLAWKQYSKRELATWIAEN